MDEVPGAKWFKDLTDTLQTLCKDSGYSSSSVDLNSRRPFEFDFEPWEEGRDLALRSWDEVLRFQATFSNPDTWLSLDIEMNRLAVQISLRAPSIEAAEALIGGVEKILALRQDADEGQKKHILVKRNYYPGDLPLAQWLDKAYSIAVSIVGSSGYFKGTLILDKNPEESAFSGMVAMQAEIPNAMERLTAVEIWMSGKGSRIWLRYDTRRVLIRLEIESRTTDLSQRAHTQFVQSCGFQEAPDDPYRFRRFSKSYSVRSWKGNSGFADAIGQILNEAFGKQLALKECFFTHGNDDQDLEAFLDLEIFLKRLGDGSIDVRLAKVYAEGPNGKALGIFLDRKEKKFEIRSSLHRKAFNKAAESFENAMDLKLVNATTQPASDEAHQKKSSDSLLIRFLGGLLFLMGGLFASIEFIKAAIPQYQVRFTFPPDSGIYQTDQDSLQIHWATKKIQWWDSSDVTTPKTDVKLLNQMGRVILETRVDTPQLNLNLQERLYEVHLSVPKLGKSARLRIAKSPVALIPEDRGTIQAARISAYHDPRK